MAKTVIDVSYAQPNVDWNKAKNDIDGAILRCGYGSDIASQDDTQWARNVAEVERLGIPYGVYLYSYADSTAKIQSEIAHTLRLIKGHNPKLGVFLDLEENRNGWIAPTAAEMWCREINAAGYKAGIYCGAYFYRQFMPGVHEKVDALWWIAGYGHNSGVPELNFKPNPGFEYDAWQYTSRKVISGINGGVDCSEWYVPFDAVEIPPIWYRGHSQSYGWFPAVKDGEWAGIRGESKRLEALKITPPEGMVLEVTAHLQGIGDVVYSGIERGENSGLGSSKNDPIIGSVGESRRIEGISIRCLKNTTGMKLNYQGHCQGIGDTPVCSEGRFCGTRGESRRLEAFRIWLSK